MSFVKASKRLDSLLKLRDSLKDAADKLVAFDSDKIAKDILKDARSHAQEGDKPKAKALVAIADGIHKDIEFGYVAGLLMAAVQELERLDEIADKAASEMGMKFVPDEEDGDKTAFNGYEDDMLFEDDMGDVFIEDDEDDFLLEYNLD